MAKSQKTPRKMKNFLSPKLRGLSLLEAMLALAIGGIVITQSIFGLSEYTSGIQVQAAASKMSILHRAADRFAEDNYSNLVSNAPQELPISVLEPYAGDNIGTDSFGNTYKLSTRTYQITVPDPVNGGTMNETALQVLVVGEYADPAATAMTEEITLRSDVANTAGSAAGFIAMDELTCPNGAGGTRNNGDICGAFGAYSFPAAAFSATNFSNAAVVSLITKGDSSVYGDQLYRYDYGDPELNTMQTDLHMNDNDIDNAGNITRVTSIDLDGGAGTSNPATIRSTNGKTLRLEGNSDVVVRSNNGAINLNSSTNTINLTANTVPAFPCAGQPCTDDFVQLRSGNSKLRLVMGETVFGNKESYTHAGNELRTGSGNIWAGIARIRSIEAKSVNSLFAQSSDVLRLQRNRQFGEVVIGQRVRYNPDGNGGIYELSDGDLTAQHVQVQDITCADCGGSLAAILPKWRHMGTYYIPRGTQSVVPKPVCHDNRTRIKNRPAVGDNLAYNDSYTDGRYEAKIIVLPRQMAFSDGGGNNVGTVNWHFRASDNGTAWIAEADTQNAHASALAKTYCVFVGGNPDPSGWHGDIHHRDNSATWDPNFNHIE